MNKCAHDGLIVFNERVNGWRYMSYTPEHGDEEMNNDQTRYVRPKTGTCDQCGARVPLPAEGK